MNSFEFRFFYSKIIATWRWSTNGMYETNTCRKNKEWLAFYNFTLISKKKQNYLSRSFCCWATMQVFWKEEKIIVAIIVDDKKKLREI